MFIAAGTDLGNPSRHQPGGMWHRLAINGRQANCAFEGTPWTDVVATPRRGVRTSQRDVPTIFPLHILLTG